MVGTNFATGSSMNSNSGEFKCRALRKWTIPVLTFVKKTMLLNHCSVNRLLFCSAKKIEY